ncbi:hypothetical protein GV794_13410 [Nocardia cyriacigeorgica]|uniref:Uncharacterized protein n=1 Tax=Nocardia cyriacigeorgica TaxID=135487 RepID=A0A6P1D2X1_9NOCA|nr:hypothetical protein [Nocardia cyriacigeorgica]NEW37458.1 hypothetical protein [Nocardia cyriacigeorgica]NEW44935.1 hypothetical protein [Nocardia cyriacigeorgica]NEW49154.1 hypothetical protein [Nocardia cyriacigeorgica]NEW56644.1 hypothetical protein [Nocardia cyriacigeorgica]
MITATLIVATLGVLRRLRRREGSTAAADLGTAKRDSAWWRPGAVAASAAALSGATLAAAACVAC